MRHNVRDVPQLKPAAQKMRDCAPTGSSPSLGSHIPTTSSPPPTLRPYTPREQAQAQQQAECRHEHRQRTDRAIGVAVSLVTDGADGGDYVAVVRQRVECAGGVRYGAMQVVGVHALRKKFRRWR